MATRLQGLAELAVAPGGAAGQTLPALVIGLGGSGTNTARRVKRLVRERYGETTNVRFLFVDCDRQAYNPRIGMADVDASERASIVAEQASSVFDLVRSGQRPNIASWLPSNLDVSTLVHGIGAGGVRPRGRFALFCQASTLRARLEAWATELNDLRQAILSADAGGADVPAKCRVYIISSLCGGTGSSTFIDVALLADQAMGGRDMCDLFGVFFMPSVFDRTVRDDADRMQLRRNAYAALKELEYLAHPSTYTGVPLPVWTADYHPGRAEARSPVLDQCFVVELRNERHQQLASMDDVFEMTARSITLDIDRQMGGAARSAEVDVMTILVGPGLFPQKRRAIFHSWATSSLRVPVEELIVFGGLQSAAKVIRNHLIGTPPAPTDGDQRIDQLLFDAGLDVVQQSHRLAENLGANLNYDVGFDRPSLEAAAGPAGYHGETGRARYAAGRIRQAAAAVGPAVQHELVPVLQARRDQRYDEAVAKLLDSLAGWLREGGVAAVVSLLERLRDRLQEGAGVLRTAVRRCEEQTLSNIENDLKEKIAFLEQFGPGWVQIFKPHIDEETMEDAIALLRDLGAHAYRLATWRAAHEALTSGNLNPDPRGPARPGLLPLVESWLASAQAALARLEKAAQVLDEDLSASAPREGGTDDFVLDASIIPAADYPKWIERVGLNAAEQAQRALDSLGGDAPAKLRALAGEDLTPEAAAERLAESVARQCGGVIRDWLLQNASLPQVLRAGVDGENNEAAVARDLLRRVRALLEVCRPFWTARPALNETGTYRGMAAAGVPADLAGEQGPVALIGREELEQLTASAHIALAFVPQGNRFRLEFVARRYGTTGYNMASVTEMRGRYHDPQTDRELHHIDRRFASLPDLFPEEQQVIEGRELFAWGLAYGYIAQRGSFYYCGVDADSQPPRRRYSTDYKDAVPVNEAEYAPMHDVGVVPDAQHQLANGRKAALEALCQPAWQNAREQIRAARDGYVQRWGAARVRQEVEDYLRRLETARGKAQPEMREQLDAERDALRGWLDTLG